MELYYTWLITEVAKAQLSQFDDYIHNQTAWFVSIVSSKVKFFTAQRVDALKSIKRVIISRLSQPLSSIAITLTPLHQH